VSVPRTLMYAGGSEFLKSISSERTVDASAFGADIVGLSDGSCALVENVATSNTAATVSSRFM
jgi:hypothetical protein